MTAGYATPDVQSNAHDGNSAAPGTVVQADDGTYSDVEFLTTDAQQLADHAMATGSTVPWGTYIGHEDLHLTHPQLGAVDVTLDSEHSGPTNSINTGTGTSSFDAVIGQSHLSHGRYVRRRRGASSRHHSLASTADLVSARIELVPNWYWVIPDGQPPNEHGELLFTELEADTARLHAGG